jgi:hypothetical protein
MCRTERDLLMENTDDCPFILLVARVNFSRTVFPDVVKKGRRRSVFCRKKSESIFGLCAQSSSSRIQTFQIFASPQNPTTFLEGGRILITGKRIIRLLPNLLSFEIFTIDHAQLQIGLCVATQNPMNHPIPPSV